MPSIVCSFIATSGTSFVRDLETESEPILGIRAEATQGKGKRRFEEEA